MDANGNLYVPAVKTRTPKYPGQRLTEKYRRRPIFATQQGDLRILADGTKYRIDARTGAWLRVREVDVEQG